MFVLQNDLSGISLGGRGILTLIQSINQPMVAAADYPAEETQAFVVTAQAADRSLETYIYLHLVQSNNCVIYRFDEAPFMGDRLEEAETEALDFVESMGFIMDDLRFNKMNEADQERLREEIPVFYENLQDYEPFLSEKKEREDAEKEFIPLEDDDEVLDRSEPGLEPQAGGDDLMALTPAEAEVVSDLDEVVDVSQFHAELGESGSPAAEGGSEVPAAVEPEEKSALAGRSQPPDVVPEEPPPATDDSDSQWTAMFEPQKDSAAPDLEELAEELEIKVPLDLEEGEGVTEEVAPDFADIESSFEDDLAGLKEMEASLEKAGADGKLPLEFSEQLAKSSLSATQAKPGAGFSGLTADEWKDAIRLLLSL